MDRIDAMRVFTRVVERRSFTLAARDLGQPRSTVTDAVKQIEARLGVRLLQRTTRHVAPTLDGEAYYRRCLTLIADFEDAEAAFADARPKGTLRVEVQGTLARHFLLPGLPDFLAAYPDITITLSEGERWVDILREGVDCALRYGHLADSDMVARQVASLERLTCAAPAYLGRFGTPTSIDALDGHHMIGLLSLTTGQLRPMEFMVGQSCRSLMMPASVSVSGTETFSALALQGFGLVQMPRFHAAPFLAQGSLIELLPTNPPPPGPVSLLYPRSHHVPLRVRVFLDWVTQSFARAKHQG